MFKYTQVEEIYLMGVALLGGHVVMRGNFSHAKVTPTVTMRSDCRQAENGHCYAISLPWPAYWPLLHWLLYSMQGWELETPAEGLRPGLK